MMSSIALLLVLAQVTDWTAAFGFDLHSSASGTQESYQQICRRSQRGRGRGSTVS